MTAGKLIILGQRSRKIVEIEEVSSDLIEEVFSLFLRHPY